MTNPLSCAAIEERDLIPRYVAERLDPEDARVLEEHYLSCDPCREEVHLALALHAELGTEGLAGAAGESGSSAESTASARGLFRNRSLGLAALGGLAAAAAALILLVPTGEDDARLARFGAVSQAPVYLGVAVRSTERPGDSLFTRGMKRYSEAAYDQAARLLQRALEAGVDEAPARFFLGASHLMADRPADAARAFERVIELGETPYLTEALFYRAKVLLRGGEGERALAALGRAAARDGPAATRAAALADSVEGSPRR